MSRIIRALHATLSDGREVKQGDVVDDLPDGDEQRLDEQGALVPEGFESFDQFHSHMQDAYRGGRGDVLAANRQAEAARGGIVNIEAGGTTSSAPEYAEWMRTESPNIDETVAAAEGDPAKARAIIEAEHLVTGGEPRKGVIDALEPVASS